MTNRFDCFVVFAEMRTGSNFLESNLNALDGVMCHGEAFNPHFIGYPNREDILGITREARDADPEELLKAVRNEEGVLGGFRYFHDHDPRVLDAVLDDTRCAKIILTRNPAESYVSWKIAQATGQWKLTNVETRKAHTAEFDETEFATYVDTLQAFQLRLLNHLQRTGQTAFYIDYEDLKNLEVMNGLARFLGVSARLGSLDKTLKVQNPAPISDKVVNFDTMRNALSAFDRFNLSRTPNFEPRRTAAVPSYVAGHVVPLVFLPIMGGPVEDVKNWMATMEGVTPEGLATAMSQKDIRKWKRTHPGHRSFTVLRHPVARAHHVFCERILSSGPASYRRIRQVLIKQHGLPLPAREGDAKWTRSHHRDAFAGFLAFLKLNLAGQTSVRIDGNWCSQSAALSGFADFVLPDFVLREDDLPVDLPALASRVGAVRPGVFQAGPDSHHDALAEVYDEEIEDLARAVYQRDYMMFGFGNWAGN